jgi:hypothetical protein
MKYKQFIKNNIDIIKKYDIKILSINKIDDHQKKFYKNNLTKYKNNLRLELKSKITELYSNKIYNLNNNIACEYLKKYYKTNELYKVINKLK